MQPCTCMRGRHHTGHKFASAMTNVKEEQITQVSHTSPFGNVIPVRLSKGRQLSGALPQLNKLPTKRTRSPLPPLQEDALFQTTPTPLPTYRRSSKPSAKTNTNKTDVQNISTTTDPDT